MICPACNHERPSFGDCPWCPDRWQGTRPMHAVLQQVAQHGHPDPVIFSGIVERWLYGKTTQWDRDWLATAASNK